MKFRNHWVLFTIYALLCSQQFTASSSCAGIARRTTHEAAAVGSSLQPWFDTWYTYRYIHTGTCLCHITGCFSLYMHCCVHSSLRLQVLVQVSHDARRTKQQQWAHHCSLGLIPGIHTGIYILVPVCVISYVIPYVVQYTLVLRTTILIARG